MQVGSEIAGTLNSTSFPYYDVIIRIICDDRVAEKYEIHIGVHEQAHV